MHNLIDFLSYSHFYPKLSNVCIVTTVPENEYLSRSCVIEFLLLKQKHAPMYQHPNLNAIVSPYNLLFIKGNWSVLEVLLVKNLIKNYQYGPQLTDLSLFHPFLFFHNRPLS